MTVPNPVIVAVDIAHLPDLVRGYEQIKLDNVAKYRRVLAEAVERFPADDTSPVAV